MALSSHVARNIKTNHSHHTIQTLIHIIKEFQVIWRTLRILLEEFMSALSFLLQSRYDKTSREKTTKLIANLQVFLSSFRLNVLSSFWSEMSQIIVWSSFHQRQNVKRKDNKIGRQFFTNEIQQTLDIVRIY